MKTYLLAYFLVLVTGLSAYEAKDEASQKNQSQTSVPSQADNQEAESAVERLRRLQGGDTKEDQQKKTKNLFNKWRTRKRPPATTPPPSFLKPTPPKTPPRWPAPPKSSPPKSSPPETPPPRPAPPKPVPPPRPAPQEITHLRPDYSVSLPVGRYYPPTQRSGETAGLEFLYFFTTDQDPSKGGTAKNVFLKGRTAAEKITIYPIFYQIAFKNLLVSQKSQSNFSYFFVVTDRASGKTIQKTSLTPVKISKYQPIVNMRDFVLSTIDPGVYTIEFYFKDKAGTNTLFASKDFTLRAN